MKTVAVRIYSGEKGFEPLTFGVENTREHCSTLLFTGADPTHYRVFAHMQHIWMVDSKGLITKKREDGDHLPKHKQLMARDDEEPIKSLKEVIAHVKPHALIGLSAAGPSWHKVRACLGAPRAHQALRRGARPGTRCAPV